jgi:hypothetical protein
MAKNISSEDDPRAALTVSEFLGAAWWLANHKAGLDHLACSMRLKLQRRSATIKRCRE